MPHCSTGLPPKTPQKDKTNWASRTVKEKIGILSVLSGYSFAINDPFSLRLVGEQ
jgi:hypothetical protein